MIKRTDEHIFTWIGVGIQSAIFFCMCFFMLLVGWNPLNFPENLSLYNSDRWTSGVDAIQFIFGYCVLLKLIVVPLAIVGGILINEKEKLAGILLIIAGVFSLGSAIISIILTFVGALSLGLPISSILWITAGVMLLVKKPKTSVENHQYHRNYEGRNDTIEQSHDVENHNPQRPI